MKKLLICAATAALAACGSSSAPVASLAASASSLPGVSSGHRPGPDILYAPPADAPQLQNTGIWKAAPILVSGAVAYRGGEFIYQDYLYDDHGAAGVTDTNNPYGVGDNLFSPVAGTLTYPTDVARYGHNAADLVEFRVKPLADATAFRVTLNTLLDPEAVAFTIAIDGAPAAVGPAVDWPHGAGIRSPASFFVTVTGTTADFTFPGGEMSLIRPTVTLDRVRRQYEVRVPHALFKPGIYAPELGPVAGFTIGVGLWDFEGKSYLAPAPDRATETVPGGASPLGAAIFNIGPRLNEPLPDVTQPAAPLTIGDAAAGAAVQAHWWRERAQADALRLGDVSGFTAIVDFAKLDAGVDDDSAVPKTGFINRILASRYEFGQGIDATRICFDIASSIDVGAACEGRMVGNLQPYALYVPATPEPAGGWGLTLLLHSLSANYNQYAGSNNMRQLGDRGAGSLVVTPAGRGPDGFYAGIPEADTFEVWADVARHYMLDPDWTAVSGYSMGGFGTYRLLARWPDLFARGFSVVGIPGDAEANLASLRNTPLMTWNAVADELVQINQALEAEQAMTALGLRHDSWIFPGADHLTLATNDEYQPGADFLGTHRVDRDPPRVSFVVNAALDNAVATAVADHAYWLSDVRPRDAAAPGTIDVRSAGFGLADAVAGPVSDPPGQGVLLGGSHQAMPYVNYLLEWAEPAAAPVADVLTINATNVAAVTIDPKRARVRCDATLDVTSDGPLAVTLAGC